MGDGATTVIRSLNCVPWLAGQAWSEGSPPFVQCAYMYMYMYQDGLARTAGQEREATSQHQPPQSAATQVVHYCCS